MSGELWWNRWLDKCWCCTKPKNNLAHSLQSFYMEICNSVICWNTLEQIDTRFGCCLIDVGYSLWWIYQIIEDWLPRPFYSFLEPMGSSFWEIQVVKNKKCQDIVEIMQMSYNLPGIHFSKGTSKTCGKVTPNISFDLKRRRVGLKCFRDDGCAVKWWQFCVGAVAWQHSRVKGTSNGGNRVGWGQNLDWAHIWACIAP